MTWTVAQVNHLHETLRCNRIATRREAVKRLRFALDDIEFLTELDIRTCSLKVKEELQDPFTWPALVHTLYSAAEDEIKAGKNKSRQDFLCPRLLFEVITKAEERQDASSRSHLMLWKKARSLFRHVAYVLAQQELDRSIFTDYCTLLSRQLLTVREYLELASDMSILSIFCSLHAAGKRIMEGKVDRNHPLVEQDLIRVLHTLASLVKQSTADFKIDVKDEDSRVEMIHWLCEILMHFNDQGRIAIKSLELLNEILVRYGNDLFRVLDSVDNSIESMLEVIMAKTQKCMRPDFRSELCRFFLIQMKLRGMVYSRSKYIWQHLSQEIFAEDFAAPLFHSQKNDILLVWACAASAVHSHWEVNDTPMKHRDKRQAVAEPIQQLGQHVLSDPRSWGRVACTALHLYGQSIDLENLFQMLVSVASAIHRCLLENWDDSILSQASWFVKWAQGLALVWASSSISQARTYNGIGKSACLIEEEQGIHVRAKEHWRNIFSDCVDYLSKRQESRLLIQECLILMSICMSSQLVEGFSLKEVFWSQQHFTIVDGELPCIDQILAPIVCTFEALRNGFVSAIGDVSGKVVMIHIVLLLKVLEKCIDGEYGGIRNSVFDFAITSVGYLLGNHRIMSKRAHGWKCLFQRWCLSPVEEDLLHSLKQLGTRDQFLLNLPLRGDGHICEGFLHHDLKQKDYESCFMQVETFLHSCFFVDRTPDSHYKLLLAKFSLALIILLRKVDMCKAFHDAEKFLGMNGELFSRLDDFFSNFDFCDIDIADGVESLLEECHSLLQGCFEESFSDVKHLVQKHFTSKLASTMSGSIRKKIEDFLAHSTPARAKIAGMDDWIAGTKDYRETLAPKVRTPIILQQSCICLFRTGVILQNNGFLEMEDCLVESATSLLDLLGEASLPVWCFVKCIVEESFPELCRITLSENSACMRKAVSLVLRYWEIAKSASALSVAIKCLKLLIQSHPDCQTSMWESPPLSCLLQVICGSDARSLALAHRSLRAEKLKAHELVFRSYGRNFAHLAEDFALSMKDEMYIVRCTAVQCSAILFSVFSDSDGVFSRLIAHLPSQEGEPNSMDFEKLETYLLLLLNVAISCDRLEAKMLYLIMSFGLEASSMHLDLMLSVLIAISSRFGYASPTAFISFHFPTIVYEWIRGGHSVEQLKALGENAIHNRAFDSYPTSSSLNQFLLPPDFMKCHLQITLPVLLAEADTSGSFAENEVEKELDYIAKVCGLTIKQLLGKYLFDIVAYLLLSVSADIRTTLFNRRFAIANGIDVVRDGILKNRTEVISCMLLWIGPDDCCKPYFPKQAALQGIQRIKQICRQARNKTNISFSPSQVESTILRIHVCIHGCISSRYAMRFLHSLDSLVDILGEAASAPCTFLHLTHILLRALTWSEARLICCKILMRLLSLSLIEASNAPYLEDIIEPTISAAVISMKSCRTSEEREALSSLIKHVTIDIPSCMLHVLASLDPLPDIDELIEINFFIQSHKPKPSAMAELHRFIRRPLGFPSVMDDTVIQGIGERILQEIEEQGLDEYDHGKQEKQDDLRKLTFVGWGLLRKSKLLKNEAMEEVACRILCKLGPEVVSAFGQNRTGIFTEASFAIEEADRLLSSKECSDLSREFDRQRIKLVLALFSVLYQLLGDPDPQLVQHSINCVRSLACIKEGKKVIDFLPLKIKLVLDQLSRNMDKHADVDSCANGGSLDAVDLSAERLWNLVVEDYEEHVRSLVKQMLSLTQDPVFLACSRLCSSRTAIAELLLPFCLSTIASVEGPSGKVHATLSEKVCKYVVNSKVAPSELKVLWLSVLHHMRAVHQSMLMKAACSQEVRDWNKVYWLDIDYLSVAYMAIECDAPFSAIMFVESGSEAGGESWSSIVQTCSSSTNTKALDVLYRSLESIGEHDSIYALNQGGSINASVRLFQQEEKWSRALQLYDLMLNTQHDDNWHPHMNLVKSLMSLGCLNTLKSYFAGLKGIEGSEVMQELHEEAAWRSCQWEQSAPSGSHEILGKQGSHESLGFNGFLHLSLKALESNSYAAFSASVKSAQNIVVKEMVTNSLEGAYRIGAHLVQLQMLNDLSLAYHVKWDGCKSALENTGVTNGHEKGNNEYPEDASLESLLSHWKKQNSRLLSQYPTVEPRLSLQTAIYSILGCNRLLEQHLCLVATTARKSSRVHDATRAIFHLASMSNHISSSNPDIISLWCSGLATYKVEEAKLLWKNGYPQLATDALRSLITLKVSDDRIKSLGPDKQMAYAKAVCLAGKWLAEVSGESTQTILQHYLAASADTLKLLEENVGPNSCRALFRLAQYADRLYSNLETHMRSDEWKSSEAIRKQKNVELARFKQKERDIRAMHGSGKLKQNALRDVARHLVPLQRQCDLDEGQARRVTKDKERFRNIAMTGYRQCLTAGGKYNLQGIFRLCALWFANPSSASVNSAIATAFERIASFKWLPLFYQIASRTSTIDGDSDLHRAGFHKVQHRGLAIVANDHPHHTLMHLFALRNGAQGKANERRDQPRTRRFQDAVVREVDKDKILGAQEIIEEFCSMSTFNNQIVEQMEVLINGYLMLSELPVKKNEHGGYASITTPQELCGMQVLDFVPVLTAPLLPRPDANYQPGSFPSFQGFGERIRIANGVTAPKLLFCHGSDGVIYRQLLKAGTDDLRQDATMQQLFGLVNSLLAEYHTTSSRNLRVAVYKVVPFSPVSGLVEWVDNTMTLGDYLLGAGRSGGAHARYRPMDITYAQCHQILKGVSREEDLRKAYDKVCSLFKPVMRHFFLEMYSQPSEWYQRRLAYTRSVAANSMVGYVVGLGDRHSYNMLIDRKSAEIIHIDLGIAFEQGRLLKTPELVPFRLTRDILDGMGILGVEGPMRKSCEETMVVLRMHQESLLTIIEVFLHDPLYQWALTVEAAMQHQWDSEADSELLGMIAQDSNEAMGDFLIDGKPGNASAERALLRVKQKLDGIEDGTSRTVQGQVQKLIQEARDPEKLCRMYVGWSAFL